MLECEECRGRSELGEGWRAMLGFFPEEDEQPFVVIYCPACAESEFGPVRRASHAES